MVISVGSGTTNVGRFVKMSERTTSDAALLHRLVGERLIMSDALKNFGLLLAEAQIAVVGAKVGTT